jgi:hypothetical protein
MDFIFNNIVELLFLGVAFFYILQVVKVITWGEKPFDEKELMDLYLELDRRRRGVCIRARVPKKDA